MCRKNNRLGSASAADLEWCHDAIESVSRTFAISIDLLEEPMSSTLCVGYLLCRIADTVEDELTLPAAEKDRLLGAYDRVLDPTHEADGERFAELVGEVDRPATDDWRLVAESERVIRTFEALPEPAREAIAPPARELVGGMRTFVRRYADEDGVRIQTEAELESYCYYVAGVIGRLITNLQVWNGRVLTEPDEMRDRSEGFGHLLQLVNIAKDVHDDYAHEGNVYLPADWLADVDVPQEALLADEHERAVTTVVERTVERANDDLDDAQAWLLSLPPDDTVMLAACSVPFLLAVATLRELADRPVDALSEGGVKIARDEVGAIVAAVTTDFDRSSLEPLRASVRRGDLA